MKRSPLYLRYALRSFLRGRTRSLFGVFCVAVGIASVVAMGLVSGNFARSSTADARRLNRGDISVSPPGLGFTRQQYKLFARLKAKGEIVDYTPRLEDDGSFRLPSGRGPSTVGTIIGVNRTVFPFYDRIVADWPAGLPLRSLLSGQDSAVVSHDTLDTLHLRVGDRITVNSRRGFNHIYTITGVVPDSASNPFFGAGFWNDFAMVSASSVRSFFDALNVGATTVYVKTANAAQTNRVKVQLQQQLGSLATVKTAADVARDQKDGAKAFDTFFRIMGLLAVLIGGIGIVNTTLVAARRRTREIASLKTVGMKGRQVLAVLTLEAVLLGLAGSILGILGGIGASVAVNRVTENLAGTSIPWSLQGEPLLAGALVGVIGTGLFSYLPAVEASRARPIVALRGEEPAARRHRRFWRTCGSAARHPLATLARVRYVPMGIVRLPRRHGFRSFFLTLALAALMGYLAVLYAGITTGMQTVVEGALLGIGILVGAGLITQLFGAQIWLVSKLPSLGVLSLRMTARSLGTQKRRQASTMLALCIGMLAVGSVAILAQNLKSFAAQATGRQLGYNVAVQAPHNARIEARIRQVVARLPGVEGQNTGLVSNSATLVSVDGKDATAILQQKRSAGTVDSSTASQLAFDMQELEGRDWGSIRHAPAVVAGRPLAGSDRGTDRIVVSADLRRLGVHLGSRLIFKDGTRPVPFTVVGFSDPNGASIFGNNEADAAYLKHAGLATSAPARFAVTYLTIQQSHLSADLAVLRSSAPGAMALDLSNFTALIDKSIDKLALFPEIIGALALLAGVIIIANTVALAMLERRREIGVMKAVGATRRTILRFLLMEYAVVGFLGALAGVLLAMVATSLVDSQFLKISASFDWPTVGALLLMGVVLAVGASALTALPASGEKPMSVLRYE